MTVLRTLLSHLQSKVLKCIRGPSKFVRKVELHSLQLHFLPISSAGRIWSRQREIPAQMPRPSREIRAKKPRRTPSPTQKQWKSSHRALSEPWATKLFFNKRKHLILGPEETLRRKRLHRQQFYRGQYSVPVKAGRCHRSPSRQTSPPALLNVVRSG